MITNEHSQEELNTSCEAIVRRLSEDFDEFIKSIRSESLTDIVQKVGEDKSCACDREMEDEIKDDMLQLDIITPTLRDEMDELNIDIMVSAMGKTKLETLSPGKKSLKPTTENKNTNEKKNTTTSLLGATAIVLYSVFFLIYLNYDQIFSYGNQGLFGIGIYFCIIQHKLHVKRIWSSKKISKHKVE